MKEKLIDKIQNMLKEKDHLVIAIDGRCASGKSTLAKDIAEELNGEVIHMDDFFLRPEQRSKERFETPGENVDHERMMEEVFIPLGKKEAFSYYPFDCSCMEISKEAVHIENKSLVIVEGCYSLREEFRPFYDYSIFLSIPYSKQIERIQKRNPDKVERFEKEWIPLEESYFEQFQIQEVADEVIAL